MSDHHVQSGHENHAERSGGEAHDDASRKAEPNPGIVALRRVAQPTERNRLDRDGGNQSKATDDMEEESELVKGHVDRASFAAVDDQVFRCIDCMMK
jgi:hypothetical protein